MTIDDARSSPGGPDRPHWRALTTAVGEAASARLLDDSAPYHRHGRFEVKKLLGCGGMGVVFRARDPRLERDVALKLLTLEGDEAEIALVHEARCQAQINHPNVVTIYETGKIGPDLYLVLEYVEGRDARDWMKGRRSWQEVLAMFIHAGRGLAAVHARGLVHADFKPENILIADEGGVLVADFGVARVLSEHEVQRTAGEAGSSGRGTKAYMAPERLEGRGTDARSDQFSLCVALWECMYGVRPFAGDSPEELLGSMAVRQLRTGRALNDVPSRLREVLLRGLAVEPAERFGSVEELLAVLLEVPVGKRRRRRRLVGMLGWAAAGALGACAAMVFGRPTVVDPHAAPPDIGRVYPHFDIGITSGPPPPNQVGDGTRLLEEGEILALIEHGDLDDARREWKRRRNAALVAGGSDEQLSLTVARAFRDKAREVEKTAPATALTAARHALLAASSVSSDETTEEASELAAATAEEISIEAAMMISRLVPIVEQLRPQSKHSTVPSTLE